MDFFQKIEITLYSNVEVPKCFENFKDNLKAVYNSPFSL